MAKVIDTWDDMLDELLPTPKIVIPRRMRDIVFLERKAKQENTDEICAYCEVPSIKEFCSHECERSAAMAGLPLKFQP